MQIFFSKQYGFKIYAEQKSMANRLENASICTYTLTDGHTQNNMPKCHLQDVQHIIKNASYLSNISRYSSSYLLKKMSSLLHSYSKNVISSISSMILYGIGRGDGDNIVKDCLFTSTAVLSHTHKIYTVSLIQHSTSITCITIQFVPSVL